MAPFSPVPSACPYLRSFQSSHPPQSMEKPATVALYKEKIFSCLSAAASSLWHAAQKVAAFASCAFTIDLPDQESTIAALFQYLGDCV